MKFHKDMKCRRFFSKLNRNYFSKSITYEGIFDSFTSVRKHYPFAQVGYSTTDHYLHSRLAGYEAKNLFDSGKDFNFSWESQRLNFLPTFLSSIKNRSLHILDIGGGFGQTYLNIEKSINFFELKYLIVETSQIVKDGNEIFSGNSDITFCELSDCKISSTDIVYFGSSLQYFEDYCSILKFSIRFAPRFIIISDTTFGDTSTFACAQVNMSGIIIPRWVFNLEEIKKLLRDSGYTLKLKTQNFYPFHNFDNYRVEFSQIQHCNLVFEKN